MNRHTRLPSEKWSRLLVCAGCGLFLLLADLFFINSYLTTVPEEKFYEQVTLLRDRICARSGPAFRMTFINTERDLAIVNSGPAKEALTDRSDLRRLLQAIVAQHAKPRAVVLDLDLSTAYNNPAVDDSLNRIVGQLGNVLIPVKISEGSIDTPVIHGRYGTAGYVTYGTKVNKVRLYENKPVLPSLPVLLDEVVNHADYQLSAGQLTQNGKPCLNFIWPEYYSLNVNESDGDRLLAFHLENIVRSLANEKNGVFKDVNDRIVFIGNFSQTVPTPRGAKIGTEVLADIYLTLQTGQHQIRGWWLVYSWLIFSILFYFSWYRKLPEFPVWHFILAGWLANLAKKYVSYGGLLLIASGLSIVLFGMSVNLIFISLVFSAISYWKYDGEFAAFRSSITTKFKKNRS